MGIKKPGSVKSNQQRGWSIKKDVSEVVIEPIGFLVTSDEHTEQTKTKMNVISCLWNNVFEDYSFNNKCHYFQNVGQL